jgi:hypothetical protein
MPAISQPGRRPDEKTKQVAAPGPEQMAESGASAGKDRQAAGPGEQIDGDRRAGPPAAKEQGRHQDEEVLQDDGHRTDGNGQVTADGDEGRHERGKDEFL